MFSNNLLGPLATRNCRGKTHFAASTLLFQKAVLHFNGHLALRYLFAQKIAASNVPSLSNSHTHTHSLFLIFRKAGIRSSGSNTAASDILQLHFKLGSDKYLKRR